MAEKLCRDIEIIVAKKPKIEDKKIVTIYDNSIVTKNKANGRKNLSRHSNLCRDKRREESLNTHWNSVATKKLFVAT